MPFSINKNYTVTTECLKGVRHEETSAVCAGFAVFANAYCIAGYAALSIVAVAAFAGLI